MNLKTVLLTVSVVVLLFSCKPESRDYLRHVDPLIGTALANTESVRQRPGDRVNNGQTIPAVTAPFGMTQWTPQTQPTEKKCIAPFYFGTISIQGFRATHWLSGSCTQDYGSFTVYPISLDNQYRFMPNQRNTLYLMNNDTLSPAYLSVLFPEQSIMTELTATKRSGYFRFSWLDAVTPSVIIDVNSDEGEGYIKIDFEKQEIVGYNPVHRIYSGSGKPSGISGYFVARFNQKFTKYGTYSGTDYTFDATEQKGGESIGAFVTFNVKDAAVVHMKMGTSFTSIENARINLETEIPGWEFEKTKSDLENTWNEMLGRIDVEGGTDEEYMKFYTALYHSLFHPRLVSDVNGSYPRFAGNGEIEKAEGFDYYDDFSNWDIYRAQLPLLSIIAPKEYNDMVKSLVVKAEQGDWLPIFPMWSSYTSAMIGDHSTAVIADAAMKGFDFDLEKAYKYMRKNAFETPADSTAYIDGKGRRALASYMKYGYVPLEDEVLQAFHQREQVSRTMEYAYNDWAVAQVAKKLGKEEDYSELMARAQNYRNVFDPEKGWVCGRFADGTFTDDFNPNEHLPYITEGSPKHYTFYVPHDVNGLIELMGGKEKFTHELNSLIDNAEYWHGNEPSHQIPYLFNYIGDWQKTQQVVKNLLQTEYGMGAGGISGNDDAGQMSAWYVFGAMGFYPVCPGSNEYQLSSPVFSKVTLKTDKKYYPAGKFVIKAEPGMNYNVHSKVSLNGKEIEPAITHDDLKKGGELQFEK
jgi:predicted alpha-1,2-mannosidase